MTKLPEWLEACRSTPVTSHLHDRYRLVKALCIAWETLDDRALHGDADASDWAKKLMRRIEELGE